MEEVRIRGSRRGAWVTFGVGLAGLAASQVVDLLRTPFITALLLLAVVVGLAGLVDRRVRLSLSEAGIRYSAWGRARVPWDEFGGFRWVAWRGLPYMQLLPRRPTELAADFSALGKLNHFCASLLRVPPFSIAVSRLAVSEQALAEMVARHLPAAPS